MFSFFTTLLFIFVIVNSFTILSPFSLLFYFLLHYYQYHYTHHYYYHYYYRYFFVADVTVIIIIKNATNADIMTIIIIITNYFDVASIVSFPPPLPYLASHSFPFLHFLLSRSSLASLSSISFPPHPFLHSLTSPPIPFLSSLPLPLPPLPPFLFPSFPHLLPSLHNSSTLPSSEAIRHLLWKRSKRSSTHSLNYFNRLYVHTLCTDSFVSLTGSVIFTHVYRVIGLY